MSSSILASALQSGLLEKIITFLEVLLLVGLACCRRCFDKQRVNKMVVVFAFGFPVSGLVESRNLAFVLMYAKMYEHLSCNLKSCLMDFTYKKFAMIINIVTQAYCLS